jgi:hypothetical protein
MKLKDVEVGGRYVAKVSGRMQVVRITDVRTESSPLTGRERTTFVAINEATGRRVTIRSAQRLRKRAD